MEEAKKNYNEASRCLIELLDQVVEARRHLEKMRRLYVTAYIQAIPPKKLSPKDRSKTKEKKEKRILVDQFRTIPLP